MDHINKTKVAGKLKPNFTEQLHMKKTLGYMVEFFDEIGKSSKKTTMYQFRCRLEEKMSKARRVEGSKSITYGFGNKNEKSSSKESTTSKGIPSGKGDDYTNYFGFGGV